MIRFDLLRRKLHLVQAACKRVSQVQSGTKKHKKGAQMKYLPLAIAFIASSAIASPFDLPPDELPLALNKSYEQVGLPDRIGPGTCKTTKLYRSCELEHDHLFISVTGPKGGGIGTDKILIVNEKGDLNQSFVNIMGAVMVTYAPTLSRAERREAAETLVGGMKGEDGKGSITIGGVYFSLMASGSEIHFHAMRE